MITFFILVLLHRHWIPHADKHTQRKQLYRYQKVAWDPLPMKLALSKAYANNSSLSTVKKVFEYCFVRLPEKQKITKNALHFLQDIMHQHQHTWQTRFQRLDWMDKKLTHDNNPYVPHTHRYMKVSFFLPLIKTNMQCYSTITGKLLISLIPLINVTTVG